MGEQDIERYREMNERETLTGSSSKMKEAEAKADRTDIQ